ncbi:MAG TPA: hypothetical protein DCX07_11620, partial [Phycisphaerales bacterium]|nr:hypothetical protein [Phycisphaerales bacterium]
MERRAILLLCVLGLSLPCFAQSDTGGQYIGVIKGDNVHVRCGPAITGAAYPCTKLSAPAQVTVAGKVGDWLKILPPPGAFSVIAKEYLTVDPDGAAGTVTQDKVRVYAAGDLRTSDFWTAQGSLKKGVRVRVTGEVGNFYKIASPRGAYYYVHSDFVSPLSGGASATPAGAGATPAETPPVTATTTHPARTATTAPARRAVPDTSDAMAKAVADFQAIEKDLLAEYKKPAAQRDYDTLLGKYKALGAKTPDLKKYTDARVAFLEEAVARRKSVEAVSGLVKSAEEE